jgi:di/tricarboxylate transporter
MPDSPLVGHSLKSAEFYERYGLKVPGLNPRSFAMMIAIAAICSYLTPLEPSSLIVYGPGRYRFADFVKVGFPLTFLIYAIAILLVPVFWPLS